MAPLIRIALTAAAALLASEAAAAPRHAPQFQARDRSPPSAGQRNTPSSDYSRFGPGSPTITASTPNASGNLGGPSTGGGGGGGP